MVEHVVAWAMARADGRKEPAILWKQLLAACLHDSRRARFRSREKDEASSEAEGTGSCGPGWSPFWAHAG